MYDARAINKIKTVDSFCALKIIFERSFADIYYVFSGSMSLFVPPILEIAKVIQKYK